MLLAVQYFVRQFGNAAKSWTCFGSSCCRLFFSVLCVGSQKSLYNITIADFVRIKLQPTRDNSKVDEEFKNRYDNIVYCSTVMGISMVKTIFSSWWDFRVVERIVRRGIFYVHNFVHRIIDWRGFVKSRWKKCRTSVWWQRRIFVFKQKSCLLSYLKLDFLKVGG